MAKEKPWQTIIPDYPRYGICAITDITDTEGSKMTVNNHPLLASVNRIAFHIKRTEADLLESGIEARISPVVIIYYLKHVACYKLSKKYWSNPSVDTDFFEDSAAFKLVAFNPENYVFLVVPYPSNSGVLDELHISYVFENNLLLNKNLDSFMYASRQPVDIRSTCAGIYTCLHIKAFNWKENKFE